MLPEQTLGQRPLLGKPQQRIRGLPQHRMHPGNLSTDLLVLDPVPGLSVILHDLPGATASFKIDLVKNHIPVLGHTQTIRVDRLAGLFPANQIFQKQGEIAVKGRVYGIPYNIRR